MRWTAGAFAIGILALVGIPPAAGFFSIAAIASAAFSDSDALLTALVLLAAAALAFAGVRLFTLAFVAPPAVEREAQEPPPLQDIPLALLALGALGFGAVVSAGILPIGSGPADDAPLWLLIATFAIALSCSIAAWLAYRHGLARVTRVASRIDHAVGWVRSGFGVDALYVRGVVRPFTAIARELEVGAELLNEGAVSAVGRVAIRASRAVGRAHPATARAQQALLLAGTAALLAFWTWSAW
jgi:NADH:ubiquinone oxidoreductase subunit 5 (subunit L)/multisubunit Na+/H+ antiporter MnhA subunit